MMKHPDRLSCFSAPSADAIPLYRITVDAYSDWLGQQNSLTQTWLTATQFKPEAKQVIAIPDSSGQIALGLVIAESQHDFWALATASKSLPPRRYELKNPTTDNGYIAWALAQYEFTRYKASTKTKNQLVLPEEKAKKIEAIVRGIYFTRDLINMPTEDLGPAHFALLVESAANQFGGEFSQIVGDELLTQGFPAIHTVGRASTRAPRLLECRWGQQYSKKLTLVGKGVCFDSGGLDLKSSQHMRLMKKDMGGAAHVLGLARMIMALNLPVHLQVLIPAVENVVSGNAYRPGDVITMRNGKTVEIGNTDAEGRLVLADAMSYATEFEPDLLIDMATLTGAARVALGTEVGVMFSNTDDLAKQVLNYSQTEQDPLWQLPLYQPYRDLFRSAIADMDNSGESAYAGAIVAALFLQSFIPSTLPWMHFDLMAWNVSEKPGRPIGGEAMGLRALLAFLERWV